VERADARLARILLMLVARIGDELPFTRQEIADMGGVTVETAIRILSRFRHVGIITPGRRTIRIRDRSALREISQGS
jgi:CRP/FNR family transcriptional regulator